MSPAEQQKATTATTTEGSGSLLDQVVSATKPQDNREAERAKTYFKQFLESAVKPGQVDLQGRRDQRQVLDRRDRQEAVRAAQRDHAPR